MRSSDEGGGTPGDGDWLPSYCLADTLILGCGNDLLGDDGFGPELISHLHACAPLPAGALAVDAGMGVTRILFDLALSERKPRRLIVADAVRLGRPAGTVTLVPIDAMQVARVRALTAHQEPTSSLLKELSAIGDMDVLLLAAEPERMPEEVSPGLSAAVRDALPRARAQLLRLLHEEKPTDARPGANG